VVARVDWHWQFCVFEFELLHVRLDFAYVQKLFLFVGAVFHSQALLHLLRLFEDLAPDLRLHPDIAVLPRNHVDDVLFLLVLHIHLLLILALVLALRLLRR
jgi:hypothetical protein